MEKKILPYGLSESELVLLESFVRGPGFKVMEKIVKSEVDKLHAEMETQNDVNSMYRLQGRITGTKAILAIPFALVSSFVKKQNTPS